MGKESTLSNAAESYNILFTASCNLMKQVMVTMVSIIEHSSKPIHFFIMQSDWSDSLKTTMRNFISEHYIHSIEFIDMDDEIFKAFKSWRGFYAAYYRMVAHCYINADRILYLDPDVLVLKDIDKYYNLEFGNNYLAVSENLLKLRFDDAKNGSPLVTHPGLFNSGVMLINAKKLRDDNITLDYYANKISNPSMNDYFFDQGLLNICFWDRSVILPSYKYNCRVSDLREYRRIFSLPSKQRERQYCDVFKDEYDYETANTIVHFISGKDVKPWQTLPLNELQMYSELFNIGLSYEYRAEIFGNAAPLYDLWWKTAEKIPLSCYIELHSEAEEFVRGQAQKQKIDNGNRTLSGKIESIAAMFGNTSETNEKLRCIAKSISGILPYLNFVSFIETKYLVVLTVRDTAGNSLPDNVVSTINQLGFKNFRKSYGRMYVGVKLMGETLCDIGGEEINTPVKFELHNPKLYVSSHAYKGENKTEIVIGDDDYAMNIRGINIVIYDMKEHELIDSIAFDEMADPVLLGHGNKFFVRK